MKYNIVLKVIAIALRGLRVRPQCEDLIGVANSDALGHIKFTNRDAEFHREGSVLSQLDGGGMGQMQIQQENASKETFQEHLFKKRLLIPQVLIYLIRTFTEC